jgi:hypothetical protein
MIEASQAPIRGAIESLPTFRVSIAMLAAPGEAISVPQQPKIRPPELENPKRSFFHS